MKLSFIATLALAAGAVAQGGDKKIPNSEPCKKDGSMGTCQSGYCEQPKDANQGTCQPKN